MKKRLRSAPAAAVTAINATTQQPVEPAGDVVAAAATAAATATSARPNPVSAVR